jgi:hypothetical protein
VAKFIFSSTSSSMNLILHRAAAHPVSWVDKVEFESAKRSIR